VQLQGQERHINGRIVRNRLCAATITTKDNL
jgi:hypothetical protein